MIDVVLKNISAILDHKICSKCRKDLPLGEFGPYARGRDRLNPQCRACSAERLRLYMVKAGPRTVLDRRLWKYWPNLTVNERRKEYNKLLVKQQGRCAICQRGPDAIPGVLAIDHCHKTGEVRGLLCRDCNGGLGLLEDDIQRVQAAVSYLQSFNRPKDK